ncbi:MAG: hypothetical protein WD795_18120 [Woeseia sp.]
MTTTDKLVEMFEADRNARDWYERFPCYTGDSELGAKLWWPPLSEVWAEQGDPGNAPQHQRQSWAEAWELLQNLHADYLRAKND